MLRSSVSLPIRGLLPRRGAWFSTAKTNYNSAKDQDPTAKDQDPTAKKGPQNANAKSEASSEAQGERSERDAYIARLAQYYPPRLLKSILAAESVTPPELWKQRTSAKDYLERINWDRSTLDLFYDHPDGVWLNKLQPQQPVDQEIPLYMVDSLLGSDVKSSNSKQGINLTDLQELTGLRVEYLQKLVCRPLIRKRVVNMTRLGKQSSFYAMAVVGDGNGYVGLGQGRSTDKNMAVAKAHWTAAKNLTYIPRFKERTIFGKVELKHGAVHLELRAARPGSGLRVNHIIYEICKAAGIKDLVGNVYGSRNPMNVAKATMEALGSKQVLIDEIAANRGKRMVDVTSTYLNY